MTSKPKHRISVWSGPRNISTALMYSFAQRRDTEVIDEPFYGAYLNELPSKERHPGFEEVLTTMELNPQSVTDQLLQPIESDVLFIKNMTHHLGDMNRDFILNFKNVLLTRDPKDMLPSFDRVVKNPTIQDVGYDAHMKLIQFLDHHDGSYHVLDAKRVQNDPKGQLRQLCEGLEIPFDMSMLSWPQGARSEDGCWAKYWYDSVHQSTNFAPYKPKNEAFPDRLKPLLEHCQPIYEKLLELAL